MPASSTQQHGRTTAWSEHPEGTPGEVLLTEGLQSPGAGGWDLQQRGKGETAGFL